MKHQVLIFILVLTTGVSFAQLHPYKRHNNWGYTNSRGEITIPCIYTSAEEFTGGIAIVGSDSGMGAIDSTGKTAIPFQYEELYSYRYNRGIAIGKRGRKWMLVDKTGKQISRYTYDFLETYQWDHAPACRNDKWGLIDTNGNELIACKYDVTFSFREGLACVKQNGKWGYVNSKGHVALPFIYNEATIFYNGVAMVKLNGKAYLINKNGTIVTKGGYKNLELTTGGIAIVTKDTLQGIIDITGKEIIECKYKDIALVDSETFEVTENNVHKLLNIKSQEISNEHFDDIQRNYTLLEVRKNNKYGVLAKNWKVIVPCQYDSIVILSDDAFITLQSGKWSLYDTSGRLLTTTAYNRIERVHSNYDQCHVGYFVTNDNRMGALDANGKEIIPCIYNHLQRTLDPDVVQAEIAYKYGYISAQGQILLPCIYERVTEVNEAIGFGLKNKKWTMVNEFGRIRELPYTNVEQFNDHLCSVEINGKYGYIDTAGNEVIPIIYDNAGNFHGDITWVRLNGKDGLINRSGHFILPAVYNAIGSFDKQYISVDSGGKWGILTVAGERTTPIEYDDIESVYMEKVLPAVVKKNEKYGLLNTKGDLIIPCIYDELVSNGVRKDSLWAYMDEEGLIRSKFLYQQAPVEREQRCPVSRNNKFGYLDNKGREIVPCIYDDAEDFKGGTALVKKNGRFMLINRNGKVIDNSPIVFQCKGAGPIPH